MIGISRVMSAKHLLTIQTLFENGVIHQFSIADKVKALKELVNKHITTLDYETPTLGTVFLRVHTTIERGSNQSLFGLSGSIISRDTVDEEIAHAIEIFKLTNPTLEIESTVVTASILNSSERYTLIFNLKITIKDTQ